VVAVPRTTAGGGTTVTPVTGAVLVGSGAAGPAAFETAFLPPRGRAAAALPLTTAVGGAIPTLIASRATGGGAPG
jgi:hypothetical protein